jgi:DNA-binding NtrC family response regulator
MEPLAVIVVTSTMAGTPQRQATVLLIEDEGIIRMGTAAMLEDAGYLVVEAEDAETALGLLAANAEISVVVTDVQMPGRLDGLDLCRIVGREFPRVRILVTSGKSSLRDARECGATQFLSKPYSANAIQTTVGAMLLQ